MSIGFVAWAMSSFRGHNFAFCGKTITSLKRNVMMLLLDSLGSLGFTCLERVSKNYVDITLANVTNRFYIFGGKDESSAALIQGMTLTGVLLDEVALMPRSFVEQALARCSVSGSRLWFNCNPDHPAHWFYREWIQKADEKNALYLHFTMRDNPSLSDRVRRRYERIYSGAFYERFILEKWACTSGQIYTMFSEEKHVVPPEEIPPCEQWFVSCDYGTTNPMSMGLWGYADGVWYRIREYYYNYKINGERLTDEEYYQALEDLVGEYPIETVVVNPSAISFITCIQRHQRFIVQPADNDVMSGIQDVSNMLTMENLKFSAACQDILREFREYRWNDSAKGDAPIKENDHAMDDMRYFVHTIVSGKRQEQNRFFSVTVR